MKSELKRLVNSTRFYKKINKEILQGTSFLDTFPEVTIIERVHYIKNDINEPVICPYCKENRVKFNSKKYKLNTFCSKECGDNGREMVTEKIKQTNLERYGVTSTLSTKQVKEKTKETLMRKYGVDNPMKNEEIKNKSVKNSDQTLNIKRMYDKIKKDHNVSHPMKLESTKKKTKETLMRKYGVDNPMKNEGIKSRAIQSTLIDNYSSVMESNEVLTRATPLFTKEEYHGKGGRDREEYEYPFQCNFCNLEFKSSLTTWRFFPRCPECFPMTSSVFEGSIYQIINSAYTGEIVRNDKRFGVEIDILIPDLKIGIECNGLYWHSDKNGKDNMYHLNKTKVMEEQGYRLIHIFEDEYVNKIDILQWKIFNILKLSSPTLYSARDGIIKEINVKEKDEFLESNHIQGKDRSSIRLGLYIENKLVSVMTFGKLRKSLGHTSEDDSYELLRFAGEKESNVRGGFSKLLTYFKRNYDFDKIITYADRRWSVGNVYLHNGFTFTHFSKPSYWYYKSSGSKVIRQHRFKYRKSELKKLFPNEFSIEKTEKEIMDEVGYVRIWDCGNYVFELTNER